MDKILDITEKYDQAFVKEGLSSVEALNKFALIFYKDVAETYDCITRIRNIERNPRGFSLNDAPILGLLVRVWKLLKEVIYYYGENNAEIIGILERPLIEAAVVAQYLMTSDQSIVEDYRKCSYKDRVRLLRNIQMGSAFYKTKAGQRLIKSVRKKMEFAGRIEIDAVVARADPIAVIVDESFLDSQPAQGRINVEDRRQRLLEAVGRRLVENFAQVD